MDLIILDMGPDVKGELTREGFKDKIELLSFNHGVAMEATGDMRVSDRASDRPSHQAMSVMKYLDRASLVLNQSCCEGKTFPQVDIIIGRDDHGSVAELMRYTMKNVHISSITIGGGGGDKPFETLTLNYNQLTWSYSAKRPESDSDVDGKWNLSTNSPE